MVKRIYLRKGVYALVDDDDAERVSRVDWHVVRSGRTWYARTSSPKIGASQRKMHRLIMRAKPGEIVDHINGDGLDNRKHNLRIVSAQENADNKHGHDRFYKHTVGKVVPTPFQRPEPNNLSLKQSAGQKRLNRLRRAHNQAAKLRAAQHL